jgi:hypothetical protein
LSSLPAVAYSESLDKLAVCWTSQAACVLLQDVPYYDPSDFPRTRSADEPTPRMNLTGSLAATVAACEMIAG